MYFSDMGECQAFERLLVPGCGGGESQCRIRLRSGMNAHFVPQGPAARVVYFLQCARCPVSRASFTELLRDRRAFRPKFYQEESASTCETPGPRHRPPA